MLNLDLFRRVRVAGRVRAVSCALALIVGTGLLAAAELQPVVKEPLSGVLSISVEPKEVSLRGENRRQQLLVTAQSAGGMSRDVSHLATIESASSAIAKTEGAVVSGIAD